MKLTFRLFAFKVKQQVDLINHHFFYFRIFSVFYNVDDKAYYHGGFNEQDWESGQGFYNFYTIQSAG